jgi:acetyltransferase-like isoleucine patch superfamily enzyme
MVSNVFSITYRVFRKIKLKITKAVSRQLTFLKLAGNGVQFHRDLKCNGVPVIDVHRTGSCKIGRSCSINSSLKSNPIGRYSPTFIIVRDDAKLLIGNCVGMSSTAIICHDEINIGNNVKFGGNVVIYDTDFHSLDKIQRRLPFEDRKNTVTRKVVIEDDVFIGAHSTILKGVNIGAGSIIGACSVVTKSIPSNEIWAGNPAKFIKSIAHVD